MALDTSNKSQLRKKNTHNIMNMLRKYTMPYIPSLITGIRIKISGRMTTQRVIPRYTIQTRQEGSLARVKVNYTDKSRFTGKNKRGAFSFTVRISHI